MGGIGFDGGRGFREKSLDNRRHRGAPNPNPPPCLHTMGNAVIYANLEEVAA